MTGAPEATYGLWDSVDQLWLGDRYGPVTFTDENLARLLAEVAAVKAGWPAARVRALLFTGAGRKRDELAWLRTATEVEDYLDRREQGLAWPI